MIITLHKIKDKLGGEDSWAWGVRCPGGRILAESIDRFTSADFAKDVAVKTCLEIRKVSAYPPEWPTQILEKEESDGGLRLDRPGETTNG